MVQRVAAEWAAALSVSTARLRSFRTALVNWYGGSTLRGSAERCSCRSVGSGAGRGVQSNQAIVSTSQKNNHGTGCPPDGPAFGVHTATSYKVPQTIHGSPHRMRGAGDAFALVITAKMTRFI
jgi:hypothetical protein